MDTFTFNKNEPQLTQLEGRHNPVNQIPSELLNSKDFMSSLQKGDNLVADPIMIQPDLRQVNPNYP
jgi:hypothetical protein